MSINNEMLTRYLSLSDNDKHLVINIMKMMIKDKPENKVIAADVSIHCIHPDSSTTEIGRTSTKG